MFGFLEPKGNSALLCQVYANVRASLPLNRVEKVLDLFQAAQLLARGRNELEVRVAFLDTRFTLVCDCFPAGREGLDREQPFVECAEGGGEGGGVVVAGGK